VTEVLATRLSDPIPMALLSSQLSDLNHVSLADRLELEDRMEVEHPLELQPMVVDDPHLAAISNMMATEGPLMLDLVPYDYPWMSQSDHEGDDTNEQMEEVGYKKTKRGSQDRKSKDTENRMKNMKNDVVVGCCRQ